VIASTPGGRRILVLDDEAAVCTFTQRVLTEYGFLCDVAMSGEQALELATGTAYDLLLLDIELPDVRGDEVLRRLRGSAQPPHQKVIVVSGSLPPDDLAAMLSSGADDFLVKPLRIAPLLARVMAALRLKEAEDRSERLHQEFQLANAGLEVRVQERTRDLQTANEALQVEIAERKQAEQAFQRVHAENQRLLATISSILVVLDERGRVTAWNTTAERTFAIPQQQAVGKPLTELPIPWVDERLAREVERMRSQPKARQLDDVAFVRPDGNRGYLGVSLTPIPAASGMAQGILLFGADVTERRLLSAQLVHAQKLESIGQLAAGIAHEINTPIQYLGDNTTFLRAAFADLWDALRAYGELLRAAQGGASPPGLADSVGAVVARADLEYLAEEIPKAVPQSLEGVERVAKIVRAMKEFSHPGGEEKTAVDINRAIDSTIMVARNEWKYVADLDADLDPALPLVPCLPDEFNQVILNLLVNAAHAIAERRGGDGDPKGRITIRTRCQADWVEIRVGDTGGGIPEAIRSRIFEPFFTTKPVGKGTGQGLTIAHNVIVKKHGGRISFETEVGRGTTFIIALPLGASAGLEERVSRDTPAGVGHLGR